MPCEWVCSSSSFCSVYSFVNLLLQPGDCTVTQVLTLDLSNYEERSSSGASARPAALTSRKRTREEADEDGLEVEE